MFNPANHCRAMVAAHMRQARKYRDAGNIKMCHEEVAAARRWNNAIITRPWFLYD